MWKINLKVLYLGASYGFIFANIYHEKIFFDKNFQKMAIFGSKKVFSKNNCSVYGISKDSLESHKKFKKKYKIKFDLLSDEKKIAIKAYKVWGKKQFMGKEFMGLIRSSFLIKNKKIIKEWRSVRVKNHAQEVLNYILDK